MHTPQSPELARMAAELNNRPIDAEAIRKADELVARYTAEAQAAKAKRTRYRARWPFVAALAVAVIAFAAVHA